MNEARLQPSAKVSTIGPGTKAELSTVLSSIPESELAYTRNIYQALVTERKHSVAWILLLLVLMLTALLTWAALTNVEEITRGDATVIPSTREQIIQSLEGGIISEVYVREGAVVQAGQPLVRIDATKAQSSVMEGVSKAMALKATAVRLRSESRGAPLIFPEDVKAIPELVKNETDTYIAKRRAVDESVSGLLRSKAFANTELQMLQPLAAKGLVAETEVLRLRRSINELDIQITERQNKLRADSANELVKVEAELAQTNETLVARQDLLRRTTLTAPLRGTVKNIRFNTVGGVVQPAQDILEIVPLEDKLLVEAKIRPADVAFLRPGLEAVVKITAYDYTTYGGLSATLELISPDTLKDEQRRGQPDDTFYRVVVKTDKAELGRGDKTFPIIPGMTAVVEIKTGEKSVLSYLIKPFNKAREALRER